MSGDIKYQFEVNLADPNNAHSVLHRLVCEAGGASMSILEVGCSSGYVGATFAGKDHRVTGVEPDPAAAEAARMVLQEVHCQGIADFLRTAPARQYDAILFGDVLEHLPDPSETLRQCTPPEQPASMRSPASHRSATACASSSSRSGAFTPLDHATSARAP